jgi:PiT family inorganic phosphate transporter
VSTAATILASTHVGFALSTTHVASGSVIGSGLGRRGSKVQWSTARRIVFGWLLTLPAPTIAALLTKIGTVGIVIDTAAALGFMVVIFVLAQPDRVDASSLEAEVNAAGTAVRQRKRKRRTNA